MVKQIPNYIANKILKAADLINQWKSQSQDTILGYDGTTRVPKSEFNIGDLIAIVNGSLVEDILMRTGGKLQNYSAAGALLNEKTIDEIFLELSNFNTKYIEDLVPSNNTITPASKIDVSVGRCITRDGSEILSLATPTTADLLNHITPAINATYHLFLYKDTFGSTVLDFSTSLTPAIGTDADQLPDLDGTKYRRIGSFRTDGATNLFLFTCYNDGDAIYKSYKPDALILYIGAPFTSPLTTSVPLGIKFYADFNIIRADYTLPDQHTVLYDIDNGFPIATAQSSRNLCGAPVPTGDHDNGNYAGFLHTNVSAQIGVIAASVGTLHISIYGYRDYRNYY